MQRATLAAPPDGRDGAPAVRTSRGPRCWRRADGRQGLDQDSTNVRRRIATHSSYVELVLIRSSLLVAALLAFAPAAMAQEQTAEHFATKYWFDPEGYPYLEALTNPAMADLTFTEWRRCAPEAPCVAIASTPPNSPTYTSGGSATPGDTAPGTVFEASYTRAGSEVTVRTPPWTGRVTLAAPPAVTGEPVVGRTVDVQSAKWDGGWGPGSTHQHVDLFACPTPAGGDCWGVEPRLEARFAGWYLIARTQHHPNGVFNEVAGWPVPPYPVWGGLDTSITDRYSVYSAPVQVLPPPAVPPVPVPERLPDVAKPKAPTAALRAKALRRNGRLQLGRVTCEIRCTVKLTVAGRARTFKVLGTSTLTTSLRKGRMVVRVVVDGRLLASKRVSAR
jgi:hypothetical protein